MPQIDLDEVKRRFRFYKPGPDTAIMIQHTHDEYLRLAETMARTLPESREKSLAITALEESRMWANAAIARHTTG